MLKFSKLEAYEGILEETERKTERSFHTLETGYRVRERVGNSEGDRYDTTKARGTERRDRKGNRQSAP